MPELLYRIALRNIPRLGREQARRLLERFGSARAVFGREPALLSGLVGRSAALALAAAPALDDARRELDAAARLGLGVLSPESPGFPPRLREIPDAPLLLYSRGTLPGSDAAAVAVVGSRRPSPRARASARSFSAELASAGAVVVSGLAYGIDSAAHEGALDAKGITVAVLASGLDEPTPRGNARLAQRILDGGGAWLSEQPPGRHALPRSFPERNRLISGMARVTLVVEARERSGSLWTARHALEQGRDVLAVPGPIDTELCRGSNALLRDGATLILDREDLLYAALGVSRARAAGELVSRPRPRLPEQASAASRKLVDLLCEGPQDVDALGRAAGLSAAQLAGVLLELELGGLVSREGRRIALRR